MEHTPIEQLIADLQDDFSRPDVFWQIAVIVLAIVIGWIASTWLERRVRAHADAASLQGSAHAALGVGAAAFSRVLFPLAVLGVVLVGRGILGHFFPTRLLSLAVPLATSFAGVRVFVYLMRKAFSARAHSAGAFIAFERTFATVIWIGVAMHITGVLPEVTGWLDELKIPLGKSHASLLDVLIGVVSVAFAMIIALWLGALLESRLDHADGLDPSLRAVFARIGRTVLVMVAVLVGLSMVGFDLTLLSVFGGALGVGLGFGLQKIASNYVSGFIILLDKSLRIGDMITIDKYYGAVTQIKTRYTVIRSLDGTEAIVPNEMLVSDAVTNHSYTDRRIRLSTRVQVGYDSDLELVQKLLSQATRVNQRVLDDPAPTVALVEFASDGLTFELGFWIRDPEQGRQGVTSDINFEILRLFRAHGIEIPFPQRDIRITHTHSADSASGNTPETRS